MREFEESKGINRIYIYDALACILDNLCNRSPDNLHCDQHYLQVKIQETKASDTSETRLGEGCCLSLSVSSPSFSPDNITILLEAGDMAEDCRYSLIINE